LECGGSPPLSGLHPAPRRWQVRALTRLRNLQAQPLAYGEREIFKRGELDIFGVILNARNSRLFGL
jgi:hypothetical protein